VVVNEVRQEQRTREVPFTVMVPKQIEQQFTQVVQRPITEQQTVTYTEMVPEVIERETQVPVTVMVARQITVAAPGEPITR